MSGPEAYKIPYHPLRYQEWPLIREYPDLQTAVTASIKAGKLLHKGFYSKYHSFVKQDRSEYTPFDTQAEIVVGDHIRKTDPQAVIMGEELPPNEDISGKTFG